MQIRPVGKLTEACKGHKHFGQVLGQNSTKQYTELCMIFSKTLAKLHIPAPFLSILLLLSINNKIQRIFRQQFLKNPTSDSAQI